MFIIKAVRCYTCGIWIERFKLRRCCGITYPPYPELLPERPTTYIEPEPETLGATKKKGKYKGEHQLKKNKLLALERDNYRCTNCRATNHLEVHHIIYRSEGGSDELSNLTTLCDTCHATKHKGEPIYKLMMKRIEERK